MSLGRRSQPRIARDCAGIQTAGLKKPEVTPSLNREIEPPTALAVHRKLGCWTLWKCPLFTSPYMSRIRRPAEHLLCGRRVCITEGISGTVTNSGSLRKVTQAAALCHCIQVTALHRSLRQVALAGFW